MPAIGRDALPPDYPDFLEAIKGRIQRARLAAAVSMPTPCVASRGPSTAGIPIPYPEDTYDISPIHIDQIHLRRFHIDHRALRSGIPLD